MVRGVVTTKIGELFLARGFSGGVVISRGPPVRDSSRDGALQAPPETVTVTEDIENKYRERPGVLGFSASKWRTMGSEGGTSEEKPRKRAPAAAATAVTAATTKDEARRRRWQGRSQ